MPYDDRWSRLHLVCDAVQIYVNQNLSSLSRFLPICKLFNYLLSRSPVLFVQSIPVVGHGCQLIFVLCSVCEMYAKIEPLSRKIFYRQLTKRNYPYRDVAVTFAVTQYVEDHP
jgi:hypothetical protein